MPTALHVPRVNNNDDEVKIASLLVKPGDVIEVGQLVAEVETDKAVVEVEATQAGHVLSLHVTAGEVARVGSVLLWVGATADEQVPLAASTATTPADGQGSGASALPTAKARALLQRYGLQAADVAASGQRLSADDVERHAAARGLRPTVDTAPTSAAAAALPTEPGVLQGLRGDERGMLATVTWHRDVAVPGYIELPYDPAPWAAFAQRFNDANNLLLNPLLPLMAWQLARLAADNHRLNATIVGDQRLEYGQVNLGFTVQAGATLYLAVVRDAASLDALAFVNQLIDLQRRAAGHHLSAQETQGTTVGFSSMSRWKVGRHIPVLAPHSSVMVAHTEDADGRAVIGATYDHRVLHGADVALMLRRLSQPPSSA